MHQPIHKSRVYVSTYDVTSTVTLYGVPSATTYATSVTVTEHQQFTVVPATTSLVRHTSVYTTLRPTTSVYVQGAKIHTTILSTSEVVTDVATSTVVLPESTVELTEGIYSAMSSDESAVHMESAATSMAEPAESYIDAPYYEPTHMETSYMPHPAASSHDAAKSAKPTMPYPSKAAEPTLQTSGGPSASEVSSSGSTLTRSGAALALVVVLMAFV